MINGRILTQYTSLQAELKKFRESDKKATMKELRQILTREVFGETNHNNLTPDQKKKSLLILLFLTLNRGGRTIKGRVCVDGRL